MQLHMTWTEERVEALKVHLAAGLSASQIAVELSCGVFSVSRNAVIGKVHRLKLALNNPRGGNTERHKKPANQRASKWRRKMREMPGTELAELCELEPDRADNPMTIAELGDRQCRWPCSGAGYQAIFCGGDVVPRMSYCLRHCSIAYQTPQQRRQTRAEFEVEQRRRLAAQKEKAA